ncbi:MAG: GNAT family N-acetyltransferase [bacterium]|nr:GNAT family N-acetyltransferase [bacterium]
MSRDPGRPRTGGGLHVRPALAGDLVALSSLAKSTFRDTFQSQNTPEDMESYLARSFSPAQIRTELDDPANIFLLAFGEPADKPIGYAKVRSGEPKPSVRGLLSVELERLYVDREVLGRGVGAALMKECLAVAARRGNQTVWLGVWEHNPRAISFYERWGFEVVGTHTFLLGSDPQVDLIMELAVGTDDSRAEQRRSSSDPATGRSTTSHSRGT